MKTQYLCLVLFLFIGLCQSVSHASLCTERGRFPNDETDDCRGYVMCLMGGITNFTQYKLTCPQGSVYSHLEQQCTNATTYKCLPNFNCTTVSNFMNPESEDCSSFISCIQGMSGIATARLITCPEDSIFNSTAGDCVDKSHTTCYMPIVKPVLSPPIENTSNHKSNNAVSRNNIEFLIFLVVIMSIISM